jgi:hypothetical protein
LELNIIKQRRALDWDHLGLLTDWLGDRAGIAMRHMLAILSDELRPRVTGPTVFTR